MKRKKRIFDILQIGNKDDVISRSFDIFIVIVILTNIACMFLETFEVMEEYSELLTIVEAVTVGIFCIEYLLRIWTAHYLYPELSERRARLRFLYSFDGIVDLLTILPFFFLSGFVVLRMLRVVRIFHLFRLNARYDSFQIITSVLKEKKNQILSSLFIILVLMFASSLCMYSAEHDAQPEQFTNAFSGVWWSMSTLLTVGYGDIYPITLPGRIMGIITAFLGVGVVAIPTGIISAGFVEVYQKNLNSEVKHVDVDKIGEILVDSESHYIGKRIGEINKEYNIKSYMVLREDMTLVATDELRVKKGDILIIQSASLTKRKNRRNISG